ncbi:hypothetical protein LOTGIDRAFT_230376 [Lottia gigantea]|uniref:Uncharacterized protein n=1 Tax=Lottia gigantea TaxID=225164 RepID=V4CKV6_LOTGI|nr:hypothetical protein LOTGIDRAFT_230376 [Lottia gigantea]ESP02875.1 hypothetical protein LOTGIDRAFT_230376 [Lottia gigantea]
MADFHAESSNSQPESNSFGDFERVEKYDAGPEAENVGFDQDGEITSTSFGNENLAEEDLYAAGASEATPVESNPLISFGDEPSYPTESTETSSEPGSNPLNFFNPPSTGVDSSSPPPATTHDPTPPPTPEPSYMKSEPKSVSVTHEETKSEGSWMKNVDPRGLFLIFLRAIVINGIMESITSACVYSSLEMVVFIKLPCKLWFY